jgi:outer membrane autotransporter protein
MIPRQNRRRSIRLAILLLSGTALVGVPLIGAAFAAETWVGTASSDWFTAGNWDGNAVPTSGDVAFLDTLATNPTVIDTGAATAAAVTVGSTVGTSGSLTISNGGSLTAHSAYIALNAPTSTGTITLQGASTMTLTDTSQIFEIGQGGVGYLNILSGSAVNANAAIVGDGHGSYGYVEVSGAGSIWTNASLQVGNIGTGSVVVDNGGALKTDALLVGGGSGSGSMGVTDAGTLVTAGDLVLGADRGTGTVTVENSAVLHTIHDTIVGGIYTGNTASSGTGMLNIFLGGVVNTTHDAAIGAEANYQGSVDVEGSGSQWNIGDLLNIGISGIGSLKVASDGAVNAANGIGIGRNAGASGSVIVESGGTLGSGNGGQLSVGGFGSGDLLIQTGGTVLSAQGSVSAVATETATATVDGNGSSWGVGSLEIGAQGDGRGLLTIQNGGSVTGSGAIVSQLGAGTVVVTGAGSQWAMANLTIGQSGTGTVTVEDHATINDTSNVVIGGSPSPTPTVPVGAGTLAINTGAVVTTGIDATVGQNPGYTGTVTIDGAGSAWNITNGLTVGVLGGVGSIALTNGGTLNATDTYIGYDTGSTGNLLIDGVGSHMTVGVLTLGLTGLGTMTISNGGLLTSQNDASIGYFLNTATTAASTAAIMGSGSKWDLGAHTLTVGVNTLGSVALSNGALLNAGQVGLGQAAGSNGILTLDSGATLTDAGFLTVGASGNGAMSVKGGATATAGDMVLGFSTGSTGSLLIDGAGSNMMVGLFTLGETGAGTMTISGGGLLTGQGDGFVGYFENNATATNTVTVTGAGSQWDLGTHNLTAGFSDHSAGAITVSDVGAVTGVNILMIGENGAGTLLVQTGGTVAADSMIVANQANGALTVTDIGSTVTIDHPLIVGNFGTGTTSVLAGGALADFTGSIADAAGSSGTVLVDGAGSTWTNRTQLTIGNAGNGALTISNGGNVSAGTVDLASSTSAVGVLTVTGENSILTSTTNVNVGNGGSSQASVLAGGTITDTDGIIGGTVGSTGTATIDGAGSTWSNTDAFAVGYFGNGAVTISNGGRVMDGTGGLGLEAGAVGTGTVDNARWDNSDFFAAGVFGVGTLTIQNGGVVSDTNGYLGVEPGAVGTVIVTGAGSVWTNTGDVIVGGSTTFSLTDGGTGILSIQNGGTVSNVDGYIGNLAGTVGTAAVDGAGSVWANSGKLYVGGDTAGGSGTGTLTVSNDGRVSASSVLIAADAASAGAINIGADAASAAAAPGTLDTATVTFGAGVGTLNFNHTSDSYTFAAAISGMGTINQIAGATFLSADSSGFTGPTNITGGALHVNGSLANSAIAVSGGGTLNGNGTVGAVTAASGGIVAPGNSIGTLTVNGDYSAAPGSVYLAQLDSAGHADLLTVTGAATLANGAILNVTKTDAGGYAPGQYTLLTTAGGISGTYTVTGDVLQSAFVSENVSYDSHDVYLNVSKTATFASAGATPNQKAAGGGADSLPTTSPAYGALVSLPTFAVAQVAFDQLSGEVHASARTALIEDSRFVREAALDRLAAPNLDHPVVWGQGFGDWGSDDGNGNAAGMNRSTKGFIGGVDLPVDQTWRVGVLGGFSHTGLNVQDRSSAGVSDNYHLGIYGGTEAGPIAVRAGATYSWHGLQTARAVAFNGFSDQLTAQYNGGTTQGFGEVGYKVDAGRVSLEPFANLAYVSLHTAAFKEAGGASALSVSGDTTSTTFTTLGLHAKEQIDLGISTIFTARGGLGWRHAFGDITPVSTNAFAGGTTFAIDGVPVAQDAMAIDAGFDAAISEHLTASLSYTGQYASSARDNGIKANIGWTF